MALTATTTFDLVGLTQTIVFNNPTQIDQITFANGQITFAAQSGYSLSKSDLLLYIKFVQAYLILLQVNFPSLVFFNAWPLCVFKIEELVVSGLTNLNYKQTSAGNNIMSITYVPSTVIAAIALRTSQAITLGEFYQFTVMLDQYKKQLNYN